MTVLIAAILTLFNACALQPEGARPPADLQTVAERSGFRQTARHEDVRGFLDELASRSPLVKVADLGNSEEGRAIPVAIVADPPVGTPEEARKSGKMLVLLIGGIHSGECDGKEALLALARDIALARGAEAKEGEAGELAGLLDHLVLAFVPIYNPDGNEKMDPGNRPGQDGPEAMGRRENAQGFDLNRDFVKLEAPETRALLRFINRWDPAIVVDTHTTNGSYHRYLLTYDTNKNPAGDRDLVRYCRETLLPAVAAATKERAGIDTFWYGNFENNHSRWETYPDDPRYGVNYVGLRNRIGVLTESYSYAPYRDRIMAQREFISALLAYAAEHRDEIRRHIKAADDRAGRGERPAAPRGRRGRGGGRTGDAPPADAPPQGDRAERAPAREPVVLRSKMVASPEPATILGYVEEERNGRRVPTQEPKDYEVELFVTFEPEVTVPRPAAYAIPAPAPGGLSEAAFERVLHTLQRHGLTLEETREDIELDVTAYRVEAVTRGRRPFQKHELVSVKAEPQEGTLWFPAGSLVVRTDQPLGNLACYLLEPEAADGLTTWNFFDEALQIDGTFPVYRLEKRVPITSIAPPPLPEDREPRKPLTFEAVYESDTPPNLTGSPVGGLAWLDDGEHFLQMKDGRQYKVHAPTGRAEVYMDPAPIAAALEKLPTINRRTADSIARRSGHRFDKARQAFVFEHANDLYYCRVDGSMAVRLTSSPQREEVWSLSPDGQFVAFVRDNDLWVVDVPTQTERALTTGGSDTLRRGKADWVYFEEIFSRNWQTYWWSPDSSKIAFYEIDSSPIGLFTIVNDIPEGQRVESTRYPKVGQPNPIARLKVVSVAGGEPQEVDLSDYTPQDMLITNAGWFPDSARVYCYVSNRTQTFADVLAAPAEGGRPTRLFRETTGAWVDAPPPLKFLKDGTFLFTSERDGWKHLYRYNQEGELLNQVTSGEWEARSLLEIDEKNGWVYISGTHDSHIAENLYRVRIDGTGLERLTTTEGQHRTSVSPNGAYFIDTWSSHDRPARVALYRTEGSELVRTLDTNPVRDLDRFILGTLELVQITCPDGFVLEGSLFKPADFDPGRKYPVWFATYGGPQAPTITNAWSARTFDNVLATMGIVVFRADPRSASGKGAVSAWSAYKQLGIQELADIETAINWLKEHPWVDGSRIGMSGHSYGGFMTAYCLTHSKLFAAGIAGAPVTDWRDYDSIYTERYMLTPQENPEGYDKTSVVKAARNLHGRLLLLHGFMDDNVHLQNSTRLIRALQAANKQFELMLYPEARHGLGGRHYQRLMIDFIQRTIGTPAAASGSPSESEAARAPLGP